LLQGVYHPRIVMDLLRHANTATAMDVYSHVIPMLQQDAGDKIDDILNPLAFKPGRESLKQKLTI
jgi:hypothetical protein